MTLLQIQYPQIDPVLIDFGSLKIKWYGVLFVTGFLVGNFLLHRLSKEGRLKTDANGVGDLLVAMMIGIILGGRLGYAIFYDPEKFVADPLEIVKIWHGGLSFHGGLIGAFAAICIFARRRKIPIMNVMDACGVAACPGIFFVRCANFINGELWGKPTDLPWGMVFPRADAQPRHPSQLYEGLLEGVCLFLILWLMRNRTFFLPTGRMAGFFLTGYALIRFLVEFVREPDAHLGEVLGPFSMGQILSAGMFVFGLVTLRVVGRKPAPVDTA